LCAGEGKNRLGWLEKGAEIHIFTLNGFLLNKVFCNFAFLVWFVSLSGRRAHKLFSFAALLLAIT